MILSQSQFYDIVQYAESKGLDPKIFVHKIIEFRDGKNIFGKPRKYKVSNPHSIIRIADKKYYLKFKVTYFIQTYQNIGGLDPIYWLGEEKEDKSGYDYRVKINISPGKNMLTEEHEARGRREKFNWQHFYEWGKLWVDRLVDEIHAIETLERLHFIPSFFSNERVFDDYGNEYSPNEKVALKEKIGLLKNTINEEIPLSKKQYEIINTKLDELTFQVEKLNKFDFRTLFFGILTNIASSIIYDNAPKFWSIVQNIFNQELIEGSATSLLV
jgi:hypothetical protein